MRTEPLKIYKASAGSGKTYTLVRDYLRLLLKTGDVYRFKRINAMTFTNKAALEMKERVIKTLNQLAKQTDKDKGIVQNYSLEFQMNTEELREKAGLALSAILHNYSDLNIQTIDKFNVRLIRSFVRDLNMSNDFEVLVDTSEFNEKVVDKFLDSIHSKNQEELKNRLVSDYLESKLEREEAWDIRGELIQTLKMFEKETFRELLPKLLDYEFSFQNLHQLKLQRDLISEQFTKEKEVLSRFVQQYDKVSFQQGFKVKNWNFVHGRLLKMVDQEILSFDGFSDSNKIAIDSFFEESNSGCFFDDFKKVVDFIEKVNAIYKDTYLSYHYAILSYFQLALLKFLIGQAQIQKLADNIVPINEINDLISNQIRREHADYIFERVGVRFDHFLLDEFQDTSRMQWLNLIPLVHNSIAQGYSNLIVGDSKQAIYRFRNGVVEQFAELPSIHNPDRDVELDRISEYFKKNSEVNTLKDNWRSRKDIIAFNNMLFLSLRNLLKEEYQDYYHNEDLIQNSVNENNGFIFVEVEPILKQNQEDEAEEDFEEFGPDEEFLLNRIQDVLSRGFQLKDICILSKNNKELGFWAKILISKGYNVSTDEGLVVSNSIRVKLVVAWMQLVLKPSSVQFQRDFVFNFMLTHAQTEQEAFLQYFKRSELDFDTFLKDHFQGEQIYRLRYENLYDLALSILQRLNIDELADPYLHFFCNLVQHFDINFGPNIERFLNYYSLRGKDKKVPLSEGNAIRLMTAHKSKGLEFGVVIIPRASWKWGNIKTRHLFFDEPKSLFYMANITDNLSSTDLQKKINEEEIEKNKLDTLNLFYVACTRAVDELHIRVGFFMSKKTESNGSSNALGFYLDKYFEKSHGEPQLIVGTKKQYTFGHPVQMSQSALVSENLDIKLFGDTLWFPEISLIDRESLDDLHMDKDRKFGKLVHCILEKMQDQNSWELAADACFKKEFIHDTVKEQVLVHLQKICADPVISNLIFPRATMGEQTLDEREIILSPTERIRPDRVIRAPRGIRVIEYKTGLERPRDIKQLEQYVFALKEMGYADCEAYLVYTDKMQVKRIC